MDIVVTIPKSEYKNDDIETKFFEETEDALQFWTFGSTPKKLQIGDRVYFIKNRKIESSMRVAIIDADEDTNSFAVANCMVTNRTWKAKCIVYMDDLKYENFDFEVRGFQGFRYKWWED